MTGATMERPASGRGPRALARAAAGLVALALLAGLAAWWRRPVAPERLQLLAVIHPAAGAILPAELPPLEFRWRDASAAARWRVELDDGEGGPFLVAEAASAAWTPTEAQWEEIRRRALARAVRVALTGRRAGRFGAAVSAGASRFRVSADPVDAQLFYREVILPFREAVADPSRLRWRCGPVSSRQPPPVVLEKLPVCANCHSFSRDGSVLGMDVDYANDKGSYAIVGTGEEMRITPADVITWSDYRREDGVPTFGLLSRVSPDGRYVVSTVKDRSVFVARNDLAFSQLFFPVRGILAVYDRREKTFRALPGADDERFVQSNPEWSPDGSEIVFTRSPVHPVPLPGGNVLLDSREAVDFLVRKTPFRFDLYRVPFNGGEGGRAAPVAGASGNGRSNYFPRFSPDGRWIVFCQAASYSLLQPDSELFILPAAGGEARRMACNTSLMNSWHSWSPNGRWLVFSSKADSPYTRLYLAHVDAEGESAPAVPLSRLTAEDRAANIPEFVDLGGRAIRTIRGEFVDAVSHARAAQALFKAGRNAEAEAHLRESLRLAPAERDHQVLLATVLMAGRKYAEARDLARRILADGPRDALLLHNVGNSYLEEGREEESLEWFRAALEADPDFEGALVQLQRVMAVLGRREELLAFLLRLAGAHPECREPHRAIVVNLGELDRLEEAEAHARAQIARRPGSGHMQVLLAQVLLLRDRALESVDRFREAVRLLPDSVEAHRGLGDALERAGRPDEARAARVRAGALTAEQREAARLGD